MNRNAKTHADRPTAPAAPMNVARGRGFSLIELLVVIAIVGILVSLTLVAGAGFLTDGRTRATRDTIKTLDTALSEYSIDRGRQLPAYIDNPDTDTGADDTLLPVADAVFDVGDPEPRLINSGGLALVLLSQVTSVDDMLGTLDSSLLALRPTYSPEDGDNSGDAGVQTVLDAWGNPIRFVHPRWDGILEGGSGRAMNAFGQPISDASRLFSNLEGTFVNGTEQLRRNKITGPEYTENGGSVPLEQRDADGGQCDGNRPYWYSAGVSGDPSDTESNVYSQKPKLVEPSF